MEVSLLDILATREARVRKQEQLLGQYGKVLICFTMNIAGPQKNSPLITAGFQLGQKMLRDRLTSEYEEENIAATGCEYYCIVDGDPKTVKQLTARIEDETPIGRLFDMDVILPDGSKISREQLELPPRRCLLCAGDARACGRSRAHGLPALQAETHRLLAEGLASADIGRKAVQALVCEVETTPKPGLVDQNNCGSHKDMDLDMFLGSAAALEPYFTACARIGMETADRSPTETFTLLRSEGLDAEQVMLKQTGGVNTHKGAIFTLGLLCGAAGRLTSRDPVQLLAEVKAMTNGLCARDFAGLTPENAFTAGQKLYVHYGITGARGQAEAGFPVLLQIGLPVLETGLAQGISMNDAGCACLLQLLCATDDTNMITRGGLNNFRAVQKQISHLLAQTPYPAAETLEQLDREFILQNLSPGGTADLLAATYFLYFLKQRKEYPYES